MDCDAKQIITEKIKVYGIVQGVGFRPLVYRLAKQLEIKGTVCNVGGYVEIMVQARESEMDCFLQALKESHVHGPRILRIERERQQEMAFSDFTILKSKDSDEISVIPPDLPVCPECKRELFDPVDRRYHNPFISCMSCGPRYTIMKDLPYDRDRTVMEDFKMCKACEKEYGFPSNRRFHAQTISCNDCGPYLIYRDFKEKGSRELIKKAAFRKAVEVLLAGGILAVKGIGGYHLVCSPFKEDTLNRLRKLKGREEKPFAVMFPDLSGVRKYCLVTEEEEALLESMPKPIVLLRMSEDKMAPLANKESLYCGVFLPYTPLQLMLAKELGPLVMTSANISGQPIIREEGAIFNLLSDGLWGVLYNTRKILRSVDDSVARVIEGKTQLIRRSRGFVPYPIFLTEKEEKKNQEDQNSQEIFAAGGDLKAVFCLYRKGKAVMSQYFGDLEENRVMEEYEKSFTDLRELFKWKPGMAVCDLHPNYHSARFAKGLGLPVLKVQHHHAHIASVMAEHDLKGPVIGVAFDGTGYGTDGNIWGGEFLVCEGIDFIRAAHISNFPILGGNQSMKDAKKTATCCLYYWELEEFIQDERKSMIKAALAHKINTVWTTSVGRLFDAAASVLKLGQENRYEGECATLFEKAAVVAACGNRQAFPMKFSVEEGEEGLILNPVPAFQVLCSRRDRENSGSLSLGFHLALAEGIVNICERLRDRYHTTQVALSGGVFQNTVLLIHTMRLLKKNGFEVFINTSVPPNDGGISLGQAYLGREYLKTDTGIRNQERTGCYVCSCAGKGSTDKG